VDWSSVETAPGVFDWSSVQPELAALEGVTGVWGVADYAGLGLPTPDANPMVGELVLEAAEGYAFGDEARGDEHVGDAAGEQGDDNGPNTTCKIPKPSM
jgi:hypothetical protein